MKQVAKGLVRVLLSLLFTSAAIAGPQTYYLLAPETFSGSVSVVSLEPDNVITAGNYQLVLNQYQRASIPSSVLSSGIAISGTKSFSLGTASDATDLLVPQAFAGTAFIVPHLGGQDRFHVLSTAPGGAQVTVQNGSGTQVVSVPQNQVIEINGGANTAATRITSTANILLAHVAYAGATPRDAYPVPPALTQLVGFQTRYLTIAATQDDTDITVYNSAGGSSLVELNLGQQVTLDGGAGAIHGQGLALRLESNLPISAVQHDDGDGTDATAFWPLGVVGSRHAIPVDAQYLAVLCTSASVSVTMYRGSSGPDSQTCNGSATNPGKVFFGSTTAGPNLLAGWYVVSSADVYAIYEAASVNDEHNLLAPMLPAGPAAPVVTTPLGSTSSNPLAISGTAVANAPIRIFVNNRMVATGTATGAGTFTINTPLVDGANQIYATVLSGANESLPSNSVSTTYTNGIPRTQSGTISADTVWTPGSPATPYVISANLTVANGATLTLQPGTTLRMANGVILATNGTLKIQGEAGNPVTLTCNAGTCTKGIWAGIDALAATSQVSIDHALIEWAVTAVEINGAASASVRNSTIRNFSFNGVLAQNVNGNTLIANNLIDNLNDTEDCIEANNASPTITGNTITNCNYGINVYLNSSPTINGNNIITGNDYGIRISGNTSQSPQPLINGNQIFANDVYAVQTTSFAAGAQNLKVNALGNWWGSIDPTTIAPALYDISDSYTSTSLPSVDYSNFLNGPNGTPVPGNHLIGAFSATSTTLTAGTTYDVLGTLFVPSGKSLTVPAGTVLRFHGAGMQLVVDGTLTVQGANGNLAVFTSGRASPAKGNWGGIRVRANGTVVEYARIEWAETALQATNFAFTVRNSTIRNFTDNGVFVSGAGAGSSLIENNSFDNLNDTGDCIEANAASPTISGNTITNCNYGINVYLNSSPTINGNNIISGNDYGVRINGNASHSPQPLISANQIFGNDNNAVQTVSFATGAQNLKINATGNWWGAADPTAIALAIYDLSDSYTSTSLPTVDYSNFLSGPNGSPVVGNYLMGPFSLASTTLTAGSTYDVLGTIFVPAARSLTIPAGTVLRFHGADTHLVVDGTLTIQGSSGNLAILTSGRPSPARGDWPGIRIRANGSLIEYAQIEYAGSGVNATNFAVTVRNSTIRYFQNDGVLLSGAGANASLIQNNLIDNINDTGECIETNNASPTISGNTITNCNYGVNVYLNSSPTINGNNVITANDYGIRINGNSSQSPQPLINGNQIHSNDQYNIQALSFANGAQNLKVNATGNWWGGLDPTGISLSIYDLTDSYTSTAMPSVDYSNFLVGPNATPVAGNYLIGPFSATNTSLTPGSTYEVLGTIFVPATKSLTVPAGTVLRFHGADTHLVVDGTLTIQGASGNLAVLTSGRATPARNDWPGVRIRANGSLIEYARIEYAGAGVNATNFAITVRHSTIRYFQNDGVLLSGTGATASQIQDNVIDNLNDSGDCIDASNASPLLSGNTITNCSRGVYVYQNSSPTINGNNIITANDTGVSINGNGQSPLPLINGNQIHTNDQYNVSAAGYASGAQNLKVNATGNWWGGIVPSEIAIYIYDLTDSYTSTTMPTIDYSGFLGGPSGSPVPGNYLSGSLTATSTTLSAGATYEVLGTLFVPATKTLTVPAGTVLRFHGAGTHLVVDGTLNVQGTSGNLAVFTSGSSTPARNDWPGIRIRANGSLIEYARIEYTGIGVNSNNFAVTVRNSTIRYFYSEGILLTGAGASSSLIQNNLIDNIDDSATCIQVMNSSPTISGNTITNCSSGVYVRENSSPQITGNVVISNANGVLSHGGSSQNPQPVVTGNQIFDNSSNNYHTAGFQNGTNINLNATGNWWGTADFSQISAKISDFTDSPTGTQYPTVNFSGPLNGPGGTAVPGNFLYGRLTGNTTWTGSTTYDVIGTVVVPAGVTLTIQAGAVARFHSTEMRLIVEGTLAIQGTDANRVRLTSGKSVSARSDWYGILVKSTSTGSVIDYATLEWANRAIETQGANVTVRNSVIRDFSSAIRMTGATSASLIQNNLIDNIDRSGFCIHLTASSPSITGNRIYRCAYGLHMEGASNPTLTGNAIAYNQIGIYLSGGSSNSASAVPNPVITGNDILGNINEQLNIANYGASNPVVINATGNYWGVATPLHGTHIKTTGTTPTAAVNFSGWSSSPLTGVNGTATVSELFFSPNADGAKDTTLLSGTLSQSASWTVNVRSPAQAIVRTYTGTGTSVSVNWDGRDGGGLVLSDGQYALELQVPGPSVPQTVAAPSVMLDTIAPTTAISSPAASSTLQNVLTVPILGSASDANFTNYVLEYGAGSSPSAWTQIHTQTSTVTSGSLGNWVASSVNGNGGLASGPYVLRLRTTDRAANTATVTVPVTLSVLNLSAITFTNASFKPAAAESTSINFTLSSPATVALRVYPEAGGPLVREITQVFSTAGAKSMSWDGRDSVGNIVPDEAYMLRLFATSGALTAAYDPPHTGVVEGSGSGTIDTFYDARRNDDFFIHYNLTSAGRVRMSVTPANGVPFYPVEWKPFTAGLQRIYWNGRDAAGVPLSGPVNVFFYPPRNLQPGSVITVASAQPTIYVNTLTNSDFLGYSTYSPSMDFAAVVHSYDQQAKIRYYVDQDSYVTVKLLPPGILDPASSEAIIVKASALLAKDVSEEVTWTGHLPTDSNNFVWSTEGTWTVIVQAQSVSTGGVRIIRGALYLAH